MISKEFEITENIYNDVHGFIHESFCGKKKSEDKKLMLFVQESLISLVENKSDSTDKVLVTIKNVFGATQVILVCEGSKFSFLENSKLETALSFEDMEDDKDGVARDLVLNKMSKQVKYKHAKGRNVVAVTEDKDQHKEIFITIGAIILGILFGFLLKVPSLNSFADSLLGNIFEPVVTMFVDALHMLIGPIVFLAVVSCLAQFKSFSEIGKLGIRLIGMYIFTTVLAVAIGFSLFSIFPVGDTSIATEISGVIEETLDDEEESGELLEAAELAENGSYGIKDIIVGIVPANIIEPFANSNLLQILFLAIIIGIGVSLISNEYPVVKSVFDGLNSAFMTIMGYICKLIPIVIFCNMAKLVYSMGADALKSILGFMVLAIGGIICMMIMYNVLIMLFARISPLPFIKKYWKTSVTALSLSSSTAAMPLSMESCKNMGIPEKIVSFAIPLGSTINMDGSSLVMSIACLFMARIYGIEITPSLLISILISVVLLSLGAPSMAGADVAIIAILISQIGVPVYAIALIMGIDAILDMCQAMSNTTGDAAVTLIVSKMMGKLDMKKYYE